MTSEVEEILEDLRKRLEKASYELLGLVSYETWGVSERFAKDLGLLQIAKKANTIDNLIQKQLEQLQSSLGIEGGAPGLLTEEKQKVFVARARVFRRVLTHLDKAITTIMGSQIYALKSEEARKMKIQQRNASASKIVEMLVELRNRVQSKLEEKEHRVGKITLSPTFERFRSRSASASPKRSAASRSRSKSAASRSRSAASRSRSRSRKTASVERTRVGRMTLVFRKPSRSRSMSRSRSKSRSATSRRSGESFASFRRSPPSSAERQEILKRYPLQMQRARLGYEF